MTYHRYADPLSPEALAAWARLCFEKAREWGCDHPETRRYFAELERAEALAASRAKSTTQRR